jgi:hypothetical protein
MLPIGPSYLLNAVGLRRAQKSLSLTVSNTTGSQAVFTLTGTVWVYALWGEVTTVISSNHTAGHLRLNDQTATVDVTLNTGITLSALLAGTMIYKEGLTAAALTLKNNATGTLEEPAAAGTPTFSPFVIQKKTGATTTLDYRYTTTNTPATGVIQFTALWLPMSSDGNLVAA